MFSNSGSGHFCQWEMEQIEKNREKFQPYQLLLASFEPKPMHLDFLQQLQTSHIIAETLNPQDSID